MKIISLRAENIKRLKAVEITPDGAPVVIISGKNANGKTSVLDGIWWAVTNAKHIQTVPIRRGADTATVRLDLGELVITRTISRRADAEDESDVIATLTVTNKDGAKFSSPQKIIDDLVGALSMDPLEFLRSDPKDQAATLRRFVPDFDFVAADRAIKADFASRTDLNREAKQRRAQAEGIVIPEDAPAERVDEDALIAELDKAGEHNAMIERRKEVRERALATIKDAREEAEKRRSDAERFRFLAKEADDDAAQHDSDAEDLQKKIDTAQPLPDPIDTADVRAKIAGARDANKLVDARERRDVIIANAETIEKQAAELTAAIDARKAGVAKAIADAALPIPGLSFDEDGVSLNGLPFDQASDAEQLRTSIAIAMAQSPKLRVIRVRDGSLLDADGMRLIEEMAGDADYQIWLERVDDTGRMGFVIEDGAVARRPEAEG